MRYLKTTTLLAVAHVAFVSLYEEATTLHECYAHIFLKRMKEIFKAGSMPDVSPAIRKAVLENKVIG